MVGKVLGAGHAEFPGEEARTKFGDQFAHRIALALAVPVQAAVVFGPVDEFVKDRLVELIGVSERVPVWHLDVAPLAGIESLVAAVPDVGAGRCDGGFRSFVGPTWGGGLWGVRSPADPQVID